MKYQWNWIDFFQQDVQPPFVIETAIPEKCPDLLNLSFVQGLEVIVTSVPKLAHQQWLKFQAELTDFSHHYKHVDYWLLVAELIRDYLMDVQDMLRQGVEGATMRLQSLLARYDAVEQFALMACLYHHAQASVAARMVLQYLLQNHNASHHQMDVVLAFFHNLTERQKDVAVLAAHGWTNQEIAAALYIEARVVAEHLTHVFSKFQQVLQFDPDKHGTRYRLIHWLTRLFVEHPYLLDGRQV